jgi:hypothetical protein
VRRDSLSGQHSALGLAIMVAIASAHILQAENNGIGSIDALNDGFHLAFIGAAIVAAVAADVAFVAVKKSSGSSQKERQQWQRARIFPGQKTGWLGYRAILLHSSAQLRHACAHFLQ